MVGVSHASLARRVLKLCYDEQVGGRCGSAAFFQRHNADITNQKQRTEEWYHNVKNARAFLLVRTI
jgi:hypothetical protein